MEPPLGQLPADIYPEPVAFLGKATPKECLRIKQQQDGETEFNDSSDEGEDIAEEFSSPISKFISNNDFLNTIHAGLKRLTDEQYVVIDQLRYQRRARISGSAGSGKTLVAAEKALRLARAGIEVLFLCHNPQLAEHIRLNLSNGTTVQVLDFCAWVRNAAGVEFESRVSWTHFDEPDDATLHKAAESLPQYDAIIVDEAQDFRDKWWDVVKVALRPDSFFYIFDDDQQSLIPTRATYPEVGIRLDLSKNCRNAQRVFDLMRCLTRTLPETRLSGGIVTLSVYEPGSEAAVLSEVLRELQTKKLTARTVVLWAGAEPIAQSPLAGCKVMLPMVGSWQAEISRQLEEVLTSYDARGVTMPTRAELSRGFSELSKEPYPTESDIKRVQDIARLFSVHDLVRRKIKESKSRDRFHWNRKRDQFGFQATNARQNPIWGAEVILKLQRNDWHEGLPQPEYIHVVPYWLPRKEGDVPLYAVADFKGLEADIVVLFARGRTLAFRESFYVGVSRARAMLFLLVDQQTRRDLPPFFSWN